MNDIETNSRNKNDKYYSMYLTCLLKTESSLYVTSQGLWTAALLRPPDIDIKIKR